METDEKAIKKKNRIIIVYEDENDFAEVERYAKSKCLDLKSFVKFATKSYMDKYPRKQ